VGTVPDEQASAYHHSRLDAQLYRPAPLRRSKQMGRPGRWASDCLDANNLHPLADSGDEGLVWSG